jgi:putative RecB family exonuclease
MSAWEMPDSISPSRMGAFLQCPLRFRIETMQKLPSGTNAAAVAGTCAHAALEAFMALPPEERTLGSLEPLVEAALVDIKLTDEYLSLDEDQLKGFDAKVRRVTPRALHTIDAPATEVAGLELRLEVDLDGWILRGIIDLLEGGPDGLTVSDWKTGRTPSEWLQGKAMLGLDFYAVMAQLEFDEIPVEVRLLYIDSYTIIAKQPTERTVKAMKGKILAVRDAIGRACDTDGFRPNPSRLCDWCAAKPYCPQFGGDPDSVPVDIQRSGLIGS